MNLVVECINELETTLTYTYGLELVISFSVVTLRDSEVIRWCVVTPTNKGYSARVSSTVLIAILPLLGKEGVVLYMNKHCHD